MTEFQSKKKEDYIREIRILRCKNEELERDVKDYRERNTHLEHRVKVLEDRDAFHYQEDVICDWLSSFYHQVLMKRVIEDGTLPYKTWDQLSNALTEEYNKKQKTLKLKCCRLVGITEEVWDRVYLYKKTRNSRCHPQTSWKEARDVLYTMGECKYRRALSKVFDLLKNVDRSK